MEAMYLALKKAIQISYQLLKCVFLRIARVVLDAIQGQLSVPVYERPLSPVNSGSHIQLNPPQQNVSYSQHSNTPLIQKEPSKRKRNEDKSFQSKRGRFTKYHDVCSPCSIWQQSGSDETLECYHDRTKRHPKDNDTEK